MYYNYRNWNPFSIIDIFHPGRKLLNRFSEFANVDGQLVRETGGIVINLKVRGAVAFRGYAVQFSFQSRASCLNTNLSFNSTLYILPLKNKKMNCYHDLTFFTGLTLHGQVNSRNMDKISFGQ